MPTGSRPPRSAGRALPALAILALVGCGTPPVPDDPSGETAPTATPARSVTPSASTASSTPDGTPVAVDVPTPAPAYTASELLAVMRASRRPGGVPAELETDPIAETLATRILTLGGEPWATVSAGGSCGDDTCTLEIGGTPAGQPQGEDLYIFTVDPETASVELLDANLRGLDLATLPVLDAAIHAAWDGDLSGLQLTSARWLLPPDAGSYVLSYRSGGEEGAPAVDLLLDALTGNVRLLEGGG